VKRLKYSLLILAVLPAVFALNAALRRPDIHAEWVKYVGAGGDTVKAYLAYPERRDPAPATIVIHEIFGMSDWIKSVTEDFAKHGYVAIAPDLLTRRGGSDKVPDVRRAIVDLPPDSITVDLNATQDYLGTLKAVRAGAIGVVGFCWGGGQSFRYATNNARLKAAVVCYGPAPDKAAMGRIVAPTFGVYAENDARITAAVPGVDSAMRSAGKPYQSTVYPGTGHGFLRSRDVAAQADKAWSDILAFLGAKLSK
jgi:carboxymethylenebutenolidase